MSIVLLPTARWRVRFGYVFCACALLHCCHVAAGQPVSVVSNVKVVSDKVEDVSSLEAWKEAVIRPGMTDQEKAIAIWETVLKFRHQDAPPDEYLQSAINVHDAIKTFNVYGYGMCCCAASNIESLARYLGMPARGWGIHAHSVPEVYWDGAWHLLDASLLAYYPQPDGTLAGVEDIVASVREWLAANPGYRQNAGRLMEYGRAGGWRNGPAVFLGCPFIDDDGWYMAGTHGWYSAMQEYDCEPFIFEYGYSQGYRVNIQLKPGMRVTRNWSNRGLHVNMMEGQAPGCLTTTVGEGDLRYSPRYGDLAPGRIGNGTLEWKIPLTDPALRYSALRYENLLATPDGLGPGDESQPAELELRVPSSYVFLSGDLQLDATVGPDGSVGAYVSDNNGLDWCQVLSVSSTRSRRISLTPWVFRRYEYRLRLVLRGRGTALQRLELRHDIQHSQRALPALGKGDNTIEFTAGPDQGTVTIEGNTSPDAAQGKQLVYTDFGPSSEGLELEFMRVGESGEGQITFPVVTPGDMTRLRLGCHYRARDARDGWDMEVSYDNGATYTAVGRCAGPTPGKCEYITVSDVPRGTRAALVRWRGQQFNTTCIFDFRIDADYTEPHGGFAPVRVTYVWDEGGTEKQHVYIARSPRDVYTITCDDAPTMRSISLELAE